MQTTHVFSYREAIPEVQGSQKIDFSSDEVQNSSCFFLGLIQNVFVFLSKKKMLRFTDDGIPICTNTSIYPTTASLTLLPEEAVNPKLIRG